MSLLNQTKLICRAYNFWPKKGKGQNFLISEEILEKIIKAADIKKEETILEIGPGLGILTEQLIKLAKFVIAVELDKKLFEFLKDKFAAAKNLELINADILKINLSCLCEDPAFDAGDEAIPKINGIASPDSCRGRNDFNIESYDKIVANLPYNITGAFLEKFLSPKPAPKEMVLLLQKEVAQRICAPAGQMSLLAVSVQFYAVPQIVFKVPKNNFWPQPEVDSVVVKITPKMANLSQLLPMTERQFFRLVRLGFSSRRKQVHNNLAAGLKLANEAAKTALAEINLSQNCRAQDLTVDNWLALAKKLKNYLN